MCVMSSGAILKGARGPGPTPVKSLAPCGGPQRPEVKLMTEAYC